MKHVVGLSAVVVVLAWSCGPPPVVVPDSGMEADASVDDAGFVAPDASVDDAGLDDAGEVDAGLLDAGVTDAGVHDAGTIDAGSPDAGVPDAGVPDAGPRFDAGVCPIPSGLGPVFRVRAMAANLTSGNSQSYDPGHGARIMRGVDPDIVMIQEFNYGSNSVTDISNFVSANFNDGGQNYDGGFAYTRGAGQIPNGVISRWPIIAFGEWTDPSVSNRAFTWARIDVPGPADVWAVSVHLLTSSVGARNTESAALIAQFNANIPPGDYLLLGGDFNTDNRDGGSETAFGTLAARLWVGGPHPIDSTGREGTNVNRTKPYDNVLASYCLAQLQGPSVVGTTTWDWGLVVDTRNYTPLSDIAPALVDDSIAPNMQHMGVIKDFFIQP